MTDYNILKTSTIYLLLKYRGGGGNFADISESTNMEQKAWATDAPSWHAAEPGLCVQGTCHNAACKANGKTVICNKRMGSFDIDMDSHTIKCPRCSHYVEPEMYAFNNCEWRYIGIKEDHLKQPEVMKSLTWVTAGDRYERFTSDAGSEVDWTRLLISTRVPKTPARNTPCLVCLEDLEDSTEDPEMTTECGHKYHISCIETSKQMGKSMCPLCAQQL